MTAPTATATRAEIAEMAARDRPEIERPRLVLRARKTADIYSFGTVPGSYGWAICSVSDDTGVLSVESDWGHWSYRWHIDHMGSSGSGHNVVKHTLTSFIGHRSYDHRHYLADKLTSSEHSLRWQFSPEKTIAILRRKVIEHRRELDIGAERARELWDALGDLEHCDVARDFVERYYDIPNHSLITKYAIEGEYLGEELTASYLVLRDSIIPALIEACAMTIAMRITAEAVTVVNVAPAPAAPSGPAATEGATAP